MNTKKQKPLRMLAQLKDQNLCKQHNKIGKFCQSLNQPKDAGASISQQLKSVPQDLLPMIF